MVSFTRVDYDLALPIHCQYYVLQKTCKVTAGMIMENGADRVEEEKPVILFHMRDALCVNLLQGREAPENCWSGFAAVRESRVVQFSSEAMATLGSPIALIVRPSESVQYVKADIVQKSGELWLGSGCCIQNYAVSRQSLSTRGPQGAAVPRYVRTPHR